MCTIWPGTSARRCCAEADPLYSFNSQQVDPSCCGPRVFGHGKRGDAATRNTFSGSPEGFDPSVFERAVAGCVSQARWHTDILQEHGAAARAPRLNSSFFEQSSMLPDQSLTQN